MQFAPDDDTFLRALVKSSRQRTVHIKWTDRDGTARVTTLLPAEATRVNTLARAARISAEALLCEAARLPAAPKAPTPAPPPEPDARA
jgi:capsid protein